jgi:hypothetical protein
MNTTGIQNYLSNVFHPIYTYDTTTTNFTPKLTMSNIYNYTGNTLSVFTAAVGDVNSNVYVGSNAGNPYDITRNVFNVTALGYGAASNISNDSNSVYIGWYAGSSGSNSANVISIGANSGGNGAENIFIGTETGSVGTSNVLIGHFIDVGSSSNQVRIGYRNQIPIAADVSKNWVGLGGVLNPTYTYNTLDVSGNAVFTGNVGINKDVSSSSPAGNRTLDVNGNFRASDSSTNILDFKDGITRSSKGFVSDLSSISIAGSTVSNIGLIRPGFILASAKSTTGASFAYVMWFADTSSSRSNLVGPFASGLALSTSSSNIQLSNSGSTDTISYSITYFPSL